MGSWAEQAGLSRAGFSGRILGGGGELLPLGPSPAPLPVLRAVGQASKNDLPALDFRHLYLIIVIGKIAKLSLQLPLAE